MKAAKWLLCCCIVTSFCLVGCGETKNEAVKPEKIQAPPEEGDLEGKGKLVG